MIVEVQVEELLASTLLPLSVASTLGEVADNPITSPTLPSLTPYIILAKALGEMKLFFSSCFLVVCVVEGGCPSIYRRRGCAMAIPSTKSMHHRLLDGGMPPPEQGMAEERR